MKVIALIFLIIILVHSIYSTAQSYLNKNFTLTNYIILWFGIIYGFVPILLWSSRDYYHPIYEDLIPHDHSFIVESIAFLGAYVIFILGTKIKITTPLKLIQTKNNSSYKLCLGLFIVGLFFFYLYIRGYGGLHYILENMSQVRSGTDDNKNYLAAFFLMISGVLDFSVILAVFFLFKERKKSVLKSVLFVIIIIFALLKSFMSGGRSNIILILITIVLVYYYIYKDIKLKYIIILGLISIFIILFGKTFLFGIFSDQELYFGSVWESQKQIGFFNGIAYEFNHQTFTVSNFVVNDYDLRLGKDYIIWLFKPIKLFLDDPFFDSISYYNTSLIQKIWGSDIPPGFIGLAFLNGGFFCVAIQSFCAGLFLKYITKLFQESDMLNNPIVFCLYIFLFNLFWFYFQNGDPALMIQSSFSLFLFIAIIFIFGYVKIVKVSR